MQILFNIRIGIFVLIRIFVITLGLFQDRGESVGGGFDTLLELVAGDEGEKFLESTAGKVPQSFFPTAQDHVNFDFMAFVQKLPGLPGAEFQIMAPGLEADAEHLDLAHVLPGVFALFPRLLILELAEVHDFHHRGVGGGRDLNHIEPPFFRNAESILQGDFA